MWPPLSKLMTRNYIATTPFLPYQRESCYVEGVVCGVCRWQRFNEVMKPDPSSCLHSNRAYSRDDDDWTILFAAEIQKERCCVGMELEGCSGAIWKWRRDGDGWPYFYRICTAHLHSLNNSFSRPMICRIWGTHTGGYEMFYFVRYDALLPTYSDAGFLLGLFFDPEDGGDMSLRNFCWLSTDYTA
jgi:hypothetical protein